MSALLDVILPVFLVLGFGYVAAWRGIFVDGAVDGLMRFTQLFAIPCLLFDAIATLDFGAEFRADLLITFYVGAIAGFVAALLGARYVFGRKWEDCVAFGFCGLFSNSTLLGLPIAERAFGPDALRFIYAIIAIHAPFCYLIGVSAMEFVRARGSPLRGLPRTVIGAMFHNSLVIGIALGFVVNVGNIDLPSVVDDALDMMIQAALPAALFGLGGILFRYRPAGDLRAIGFVCAVSLVLHPTVTYAVGLWFGLGVDPLRAAVITAAMAPGVNAYIFANIYGAARRVAASAVLLSTVGSILTVWVWLLILP